MHDKTARDTSVLARGSRVSLRQPKSGIAVGLLVGLWCLAAGIARDQPAGKSSDVPMTRAGECLAVYDGIGVAVTFTELPDGRILVFDGGHFRSSSDGGMTWSEPWSPQFAGKARPFGESSLIVFKDGTLGMISAVVPPLPADLGPKPKEWAAKNAWDERRKHAGTDETRRHLELWRSRDGGKSFAEPTRVSPPAPFIQANLQNVTIRTTSGRLLHPAYGEMRVFVYRSDDDGATWQRSNEAQHWAEYQGRKVKIHGGEPTIVEVTPGKVLMFTRTDIGRLYQAWSSDNGETWTDGGPTELATGPSPAALAKIPGTNDLLVVWNQVSIPEIRKQFYRSRLSTAVSRDGGKTWTHFQNIESSLEGVHVSPPPVHPEWEINEVKPRRDKHLPGYEDIPDILPKKPLFGRLYGNYTYPSVFFNRGNVLVAHADQYWDEKGHVVGVGRLRVVPISWLYGGSRQGKAAQGAR